MLREEILEIAKVNKDYEIPAALVKFINTEEGLRAFNLMWDLDDDTLTQDDIDDEVEDLMLAVLNEEEYGTVSSWLYGE